MDEYAVTVHGGRRIGIRRGMLLVAILFLVGSNFQPVAAAESKGAGFLFVEEPLNPRTVAMGSAGTALVDGGFYCYNPASASRNGASVLSLQYGAQGGDLHRAAVEADIAIRNWFFAVAIPTAVISGIIPATEQGPIAGVTFNDQGTQLSFAGGWFNERGAVGLAINTMQQRIETYTNYAFSISGGGLYTIIPGHLTVGVAFFHPNKIKIGSGEIPLGVTKGGTDETGQPGRGPLLPGSERLGAAWNSLVAGIPYTVSLDAVLRNEDDRVMIPVGLEVMPIRFLALRAGKRFNHDTEIFNAGFGVMIGSLSTDAGFVYSRFVTDNDFKWLIGLSWTLDKLQ